MAWAGLVISGLRGLALLVLRADHLPSVTDAGLATTLMVLMVGMLVLIRYGYVRVAGLFLPASGFCVATIIMFYFGGVRQPIANFYLFAIVAAGLLLGG